MVKSNNLIPFGGDPANLPNVPLIGQAPLRCLSRAVDAVDERVLLEGGVGYFFGGENKWSTHEGPFPRFFTGVTLLAVGKDGRTWFPIAGAQVVCRFQVDGFVAFDLRTNGSGSTRALASTKNLMNPTEADAPVGPGTLWRIEIKAPGFEGARARVILHTLTIEKV